MYMTVLGGVCYFKRNWGKELLEVVRVTGFKPVCAEACAAQIICKIRCIVAMLVFLCIDHYQWYSLTWTKRDATVFPPEEEISSVAPRPQIIVRVPTEVFCCLQRTIWKLSRVGVGVDVRILTIPSLTGVTILSHWITSLIFLTHHGHLAIFSDWKRKNNYALICWRKSCFTSYSLPGPSCNMHLTLSLFSALIEAALSWNCMN